jgi:glutamate/tyrosine decarboxylase-like PLP-dependent enzyme
MNAQLAADKKDFRNILQETLALAMGHLEKIETLPVGKFIPDIELTSLPEHGLSASGALKFFEQNFAQHFSGSAGPRYFGFVTGGSTPASVAGDWLVSAYDQNTCTRNDSMAPQIERQAIHFLKELFGLDDAYTGTFVSGATMANFVGLALGRQWIGEQYGIDFSNDGLGNVPIQVVSGTPHSSTVKSLSMLGIGRNAVIRPATLSDREAVDIDALDATLAQVGHPVIVVANAGTVNTVDFDDLQKIGQLKSKHKFWLHVDAAFGGFAACSEKFRHLMSGINFADSVTIDAHKWLNVPYDAAMQFTRHAALQLKVFQNNASYLGDPEKNPDYFHYTPESSRRFRALPAWFSLMAYGKSGYREIVERNCECASYLGELITNSKRFKLLAPVRMNVVCFTLATGTLTFEDIQNFLGGVRDDGRAYFTPTVYKGVPAIRAAVSNWQTELTHIDETFAALTEVREKMARAKSVVSETIR